MYCQFHNSIPPAVDLVFYATEGVSRLATGSACVCMLIRLCNVYIVCGRLATTSVEANGDLNKE